MIKKILIIIIWICIFFNFFNINCYRISTLFLNNYNVNYLINNFWDLLYNNFTVKASSDNITWESYKFNPNILSPGKKDYNLWLIWNTKDLLSKIIKILLIILPTLAVFAIVIWWIFMILSWWKPDNANKWKLIIQMSITSIIIALFSYSFIKLIIWILWSTTT